MELLKSVLSLSVVKIKLRYMKIWQLLVSGEITPPAHFAFSSILQNFFKSLWIVHFIVNLPFFLQPFSTWMKDLIFSLYCFQGNTVEFVLSNTGITVLVNNLLVTPPSAASNIGQIYNAGFNSYVVSIVMFSKIS